MSFLEGLSVDNTDMLKPEFRTSMRFFMHEFHAACARARPVQRKSRRPRRDVRSPLPRPAAPARYC